MLLLTWQRQFEDYLRDNWCHDDKAHDMAHLQRVWKTAQHILTEEKTANALVVLAACYFHDIVNLSKDSPQRHQASQLASIETIRILQTYFPDFPVDYYDAVAHAVHAHSFSAAISPESIEAKIVQDADRLESLGAIGLARVFYVSGVLGQSLFDSNDPLALHRPLDDRYYALDHFQGKLLKLPDTMQTAAGRKLARLNADFLIQYMAKLCSELNGDYLHIDETVLHRFRQ